MNVLLAEDNIQNQKIFSKIASSQGWHVDFAINGNQAVNLASENRYDCIMMDIEMPMSNGFQAAREIRKREINTPIVALTAHTHIKRSRLMDFGINGYLHKPYSPGRIFEVVTTLTS